MKAATALRRDRDCLTAALAYAERLGWPVAPAHFIQRDGRCSCGNTNCSSPGKHPLTRNGFKDATTDPYTIRQWWSHQPEANIIIPTGHLTRILVLDIDPDHGGNETLAALEAQHGPLPPTVEQITGSGGRHLLFKFPGSEYRNTARKVGPGIDSRGDGGYIVVAPSNHTSGNPYHWRNGQRPDEIMPAEAPGWLLDLLRQDKPKQNDSKGVLHAVTSGANAYAEAALADEIKATATALEGSRNSQLNSSAFSLGQLVGSDHLDRGRVERGLTDAAIAAGLELVEIERTIKSGIEAGLTVPREVQERAAEQCGDRTNSPDSVRELPEPNLSVLSEGKRSAPKLLAETFRPYWHKWLEAEAENRAAPIDYVAGGLLAAASALLGNARWVSPWPGWKEPAVLWLAEIGEPSSGKSPGQDALREPLGLLEAELAIGYSDDLRRWRTQVEESKARRVDWESKVKEAVNSGRPAPDLQENAIEPEKPPRPRLVLTDTTPEEAARLAAAQPRGLILHRDELAGFIGGFDRYGGAGAERAFWIEAYGGRRFVVDRVKSNDAPIIIPRLSIAVLGGLQPDKLANALLAGDDDGFAARFLYMWPEPVVPRRPRQTPDDQAVALAFRRLLNLQMAQDENGNPCPVIISLDDNAADQFEEWRHEHFQETATGKLAGHFGKMPGHLLRLALVLEFLWWTAGTDNRLPEAVSEEAVFAAAALIEDYFKPMAERTFGDAARPEPERLAATLGRYIIKHRLKQINARKVRREARLPGLREAPKVNIAIDTLQDYDWLLPQPSREGSTPGRQRDDFRVNSKLWAKLK